MSSEMVIDTIKAQHVKDTMLSTGKRIDGRDLLDYRNIKIETGVFENCEGSAIVHLGDTQVIAAVKIDAAEPFPDRPDEGVLMVNAEFSPIGHPSFIAGPPSETSIELSRVVDRGIRAANCIDLKKLALPDGRVLGVFIDLHIVDHNGNLTDACALAAMAALGTAVVPEYTPGTEEVKGKLDREKRTKPLPLQRKVVTCTFSKIGGTNVIDANIDEENAEEGCLTFGMTDDGYVVAGQKSGAASFTVDEFEGLLDTALEKAKLLFEKL